MLAVLTHTRLQPSFSWSLCIFVILLARFAQLFVSLWSLCALLHPLHRMCVCLNVRVYVYVCIGLAALPVISIMLEPIILSIETVGPVILLWALLLFFFIGCFCFGCVVIVNRCALQLYRFTPSINYCTPVSHTDIKLLLPSFFGRWELMYKKKLFFFPSSVSCLEQLAMYWSFSFLFMLLLLCFFTSTNWLTTMN